jgi:2-polyprenyl-6-hydroxyphenyl methylase/3-demethylubiquinone-9 3-methyltransferase
MWKYYDERLAGERLKKIYDLSTPRIRQYLESEIAFVLDRIHPGALVLDLGCGYGRAIPQIAKKASYIVGIDNSFGNLVYGVEYLKTVSNYSFICMNAGELGFRPQMFDAVICIQNGISAFHVDQKILIKEAVRVCKSGGAVMFSTYSPKFWESRLEWFELQSEAGLLGEIDMEKTRDGIIVCKDGFTATTASAERFLELTRDLSVKMEMTETDDSSLFCVIHPS